jgi:hypothetical protein
MTMRSKLILLLLIIVLPVTLKDMGTGLEI